MEGGNPSVLSKFSSSKRNGSNTLHNFQSLFCAETGAGCGLVRHLAADGPEAFRHTSSCSRNLSERSPSILLRKTVLSLKSPTGAFIAALRKCEQRSFCSAQNPASFGVKLAYGVVFAGNSPKEKAWNLSYHQEVSGFSNCKLEIYCSIGFIVGILSGTGLQCFVMLHNRIFTCVPGIHNPSWFAVILVVLLSICCPWKNFAVRQNAQ